MKKYKVEFYFENKSLEWKNPIDEESKKIIEKAFMKGERINAGESLVDLSKCLFVSFEEVK